MSEQIITFGNDNAGLMLTLTAKGIEISGWYDTFVGIEPGFITWGEFDKKRKAVIRREAEQGAE